MSIPVWPPRQRHTGDHSAGILDPNCLSEGPFCSNSLY